MLQMPALLMPASISVVLSYHPVTCFMLLSLACVWLGVVMSYPGLLLYSCDVSVVHVILLYKVCCW